MSDKTEKGSNWGNLSQHRHPERHRGEKFSVYPAKKPLVEESPFVNTRDVQRIHGRDKMLRAADEGRALPVRIGCDSFQVFFTWEVHKLPGRGNRWSEIGQGNCRIYLVCLSCHRRVRALYRNPRQNAPSMPALGCRRCLRLIYACENSGKTLWWKNIVRPLRRLYRKHERLLTLKRTPRNAEALRRIEELILIYTKRAEPKRKNRMSTGVKRPYKDVRLVLGLA